MAESIRISAIIPTYNREKTITRAIESMLSQQYPPAEILIIDDGSEDHTEAILKKYGEKIRYIYQTNSGVAAARNRGVREAHYEWVAFLDSDDYWFPHHLQRISEVMKITKEKASLYFSDLIRPDDDGGGTYWAHANFMINGKHEFQEDASDWAMMRIQPMMLQASVIRRSSFLEIGGLPTSLITREDTYLFHALCLKFPACAVAGTGAVMSADCTRSGRLTLSFDGHSSTFHECTKLLYKELFKFTNKMSEQHRKEFTRRLVQAHLNFGRILVKKGQIGNALINVLGGFWTNPIMALDIGIRMLKSYCFK
jgi:glycosyltransferase involved in cell wall biosynthesis